MSETRPPTILIVDDTEANRYAVGHILRKASFVVREADTGQDALRLIAEKPDLIILDVNLPDMSGFEVCQKIKANPVTSAIPVLHLSASFVHSDARAEGLESGADGYLTYPLEPRELIANVKALLRVRAAEQMALAQRELLRVTLNSIGDGVIATDARGTITFINPIAVALTGWTEAEAVGKPVDSVFRIMSEEAGPKESPVAKVMRTRQPAELANHSLLIARDASRRPIDDTASPILDSEGEFVGVVLVFRDITERRRLEAELRQRADDLAERDRRKDEFLAVLAHELRNPLAPIRNAVEILKVRWGGSPEMDLVSGMMGRQVTQLVRLVDDLLDVSRITRGKVELRKELIDLASVVDRTVEAVGSMLAERQHHLKLELPAEKIWLEADPARLEQVFSNLLTNAAKFTAPGGRIRLSAVRDGAEVVIRVEDNGIGIRAEMLPRLFEMFQQADRVPGRLSEGLGLGLSLVRGFMEMHGGTVTATSQGPGRGSEFVVRLPVASAQRHPHKENGSEGCYVGPPLKILVVDDNVDAAESLATLFRISGHEVRTAYTGQRALELAKAAAPAVIFLDVGLPMGMDGYEVARRLRQIPGLSQALIIAMTGYGASEDVQHAYAAGMNHHITKPADLEALQKLLATAKPTGSS